MSDIAIRCEGLSKQYRIGKRERYRALRDVLTDSLIAIASFDAEYEGQLRHLPLR